MNATKLSQRGFTLIELLVAIIIAALVVSGLLYLVIEMLQLDRREFVLNQTQQDMQRSMAYITNDVQEAVFVYSTPTDVTNLPDMAGLTANGELPVLAFWRPDPLSDVEFGQINADCSTYPSTPTDKEQECEVLKLRQNTYSLVVYLLRDNAGSNTWQGEARIIRYELSKYSDLAALTENVGYVDPTIGNGEFAGWTPDAAVAGNGPVLTDYVDNAAAPVAQVPTCPSADYERAPNNIVDIADPNVVTSFVACVLPQDAAVEGNQNQDVYIFLRGNALSGRPGLINSRNEGSDNPTLEARVQVRGVLDKR